MTIEDLIPLRIKLNELKAQEGRLAATNTAGLSTTERAALDVAYEVAVESRMQCERLFQEAVRKVINETPAPNP